MSPIGPNCAESPHPATVAAVGEGVEELLLAVVVVALGDVEQVLLPVDAVLARQLFRDVGGGKGLVAVGAQERVLGVPAVAVRAGADLDFLGVGDGVRLEPEGAGDVRARPTA